MMFWGYFSSKLTKQLIVIRVIMKSKNYIEIMHENLQLSNQDLDLGRWFAFQQDNDPQNTSKSKTVWL